VAGRGCCGGEVLAVVGGGVGGFRGGDERLLSFSFLFSSFLLGVVGIFGE
jgi:hypothetical protein